MRTSELLDNIASHICNNLQQQSDICKSLLGGDFGSVMFLYYYSKFKHSYEEKADSLLDKILNDSQKELYSYCNGLAGFGIGLSHLEKDGFISGAIDSLTKYDRNLSIALDIELYNNNHDFLHGFIGLGFYFLQRCLDGNFICNYDLEKIISHLIVTSEQTEKGIRWAISNDPQKRYNISLSHGISGTLILLSRIYTLKYTTNIMKYRIRTLAIGAIEYIMSQALDPETNGSYFPSTSIECSINTYSSLGWCYGDLGVALALLEAGETFENSVAIQKAHEVLKYNAIFRRDLKSNLVSDCCICHGAAGIALVFEEMFYKTNDKIFLEAFNYWKNIVVSNAMIVSDGVAYDYYKGENGFFEPSDTILNGTSGVGLFLLGSGNSPLANLLLIRK